jgi:endonuclease/exonuclease/phosphatase family metal-dependent hydrolase
MRVSYLACCAALIGLAATAAEPLRVMSFNVRLPAKADGPNYWDQRRDMLVEVIRQKDPDVLGTQELFHLQGEYIAQQLPAYKWFGISRRGNQEDEFMGVFYKPGRLRVVESGNFWLSETPETPGSSSWNMSLPRMVTWALFELNESKKRFYFFNTHFPHRPQDDEARTRCAQVIADRIAKLDKSVPFLMTGDFNAGTDSNAYKLLTAGLADAALSTPHRFGPEGTFNGFRGASDGARIDWILHRAVGKVLQYQTDTINAGGRYPSDHFPVFAIFEIP